MRFSAISSAMNFNNEDTIAAVCTAPGEAGISVIRISGTQAMAIADKVISCGGSLPSQRPAGSFFYARVFSVADGDEADEVIVLIFRAPRSYTREDVVEIHGHGGRQASRRIMDSLLAAGARQAGPGEFTCRAFLNGRIDLLQAEAVADLIRAQSDRAASMALAQLEGGLSGIVISIYDSILSETAKLEVLLDFAEDDLPELPLPEICSGLQAAELQLKELLATAREGHILRDGALVVIAGLPNVGKSTLLNCLLGHERAIVSPTPGTTRDTIEEQMVLDGYPLRLVDTAGLRDADCTIEQEGVRRARDLLERADLIIYIVDASVPFHEADDKLYQDICRRPHLVVLNKIDLDEQVDLQIFDKQTIIKTSVMRDQQQKALKSALAELLVPLGGMHSQLSIADRHAQLLRAANEQLHAAIDLLAAGDEAQIVPAADCLRASLEQLGEMTGRVYHSELLDNIFANFCIGK